MRAQKTKAVSNIIKDNSPTTYMLDAYYDEFIDKRIEYQICVNN
jgi:hypothetical protein